MVAGREGFCRMSREQTAKPATPLSRFFLFPGGESESIRSLTQTGKSASWFRAAGPQGENRPCRGGAGDRPDTTQGDSELGVGCGCRGKAQGKEFYTQGDCISNLCRHGPAEGEPGGKKAHRAEQKKPPHGRLLEVILISPDRSVFRNYSPISFQLTKIRLRVQSL